MTDARNLALVYSDILYSAAVEAFLEIDTEPQKKINALKTIINAAISTGSGQFLELIYSSGSLQNLGLQDIYTIYDLKTARYTFCGPLVAGAQLAGAAEPVLSALYQAGLYLGRAYQIVDDLMECFSTAGSSQIPSDIAEHRKTILMWHLYHHGTPKIRHFIENLDRCCTPLQVSKLYCMFDKAGSFDFAISEKNKFIHLALNILTQDIFRMQPELVKDIITEISTMCTIEEMSLTK
ncbi:MAG: hypothetical protein GX640_05630 [Fibrobacter sp.]|nr:hypothetical protein [Fibrobacter sp.]